MYKKVKNRKMKIKNIPETEEVEKHIRIEIETEKKCPFYDCQKNLIKTVYVVDDLSYDGSLRCPDFNCGYLISL